MWYIVFALGGLAQSDWRSMQQVSRAHQQMTRALKIDGRSIVQLRNAVKTGDQQTCNALMTNLNVNSTNECGKTLLYEATYYGNYDIAQLLLSRGATAGLRLHTLDSNPLYVVASHGHLVLLRALVERVPPGLKLDRLMTSHGGMSLLHAAAVGICFGRANCWDVLEWLIGTKKMDINLRDRRNRTVADVLSLEHAERYHAMLTRLRILN